MEHAILYRDESYGGLTIRPGSDGGTLVTIDHGLDEADFEVVLAVLESRAQPAPHNAADGTCIWEMRGHITEVMASINGAMRRQGYGDDRLEAKAIIKVPLEESGEPDLPGGTPCGVASEGVRVGLLATAALVGRAAGLDESSLSANFYPRPNRTDCLNVPLPFLRVQVEGKGLDPSSVCQGVRQAFSQTEGVVRISAAHGAEGRVVVEAAFAFPPEILEDYERRTLPTFKTPKGGLVKEARFALSAILPEDVAEDIKTRALESGCALEVVVSERSIRALLPCSQVANTMLSDRIRWMHEQISPWGGRLAEVGELQEADAVNCAKE